MTNLLAIAVLSSVCLVTNITESVHPSNEKKMRTEVVQAQIVTPILWNGELTLVTNLVALSTNQVRYVWALEKKPARDPLGYPPMPTDRNIYQTNQPIEWLTNLPVPWIPNTAPMPPGATNK